VEVVEEGLEETITHAGMSVVFTVTSLQTSTLNVAFSKVGISKPLESILITTIKFQ